MRFEALFAESRDIADPAEAQRIKAASGADLATYRAAVTEALA